MTRDNQDCPKCGELMLWKNLEEPLCPVCDVEEVERLYPNKPKRICSLCKQSIEEGQSRVMMTSGPPGAVSTSTVHRKCRDKLKRGA